MQSLRPAEHHNMKGFLNGSRHAQPNLQNLLKPIKGGGAVFGWAQVSSQLVRRFPIGYAARERLAGDGVRATYH